MQQQIIMEEKLQSLINSLENERANIQVIGRSLSHHEEQRLDQIETALTYLNRASMALAPTSSNVYPLPEYIPFWQNEDQSSVALQDGRYQGGNDRYFIELRLDESVSGVISADIFTNDPLNKRFLASLRTVPGEHISLDDATWTIIGEDEFDAKVMGTLTLSTTANDPKQIIAQLYFEQTLQGLPGRTHINFAATWVSKYLRTLGIEMEIEQGVAPPRPFDFNGRMITIESCFEDAGFEVTDVGQIDRIPKPANPSGWGTAEIKVLNADLNRAMQRFSQTSLLQRAWELHYLLLSKATRSRLNGIMFDEVGLPRQGVAVFGNTIRENYGEWADRKLIHTSTHELAHALNLVHRFERVVGRADSTSFMNYDWRYKGFNHGEEYWRNFSFTFDPDELAFMRHGPLPAVSPGGEPFHSIWYWADGDGGYTPYALNPEQRLAGYKLNLFPPERGPVFVFGQPIFLKVELRNINGWSLRLPSILLDPKASFLQIMIRRVTSQRHAQPQASDTFVPFMQRCFDLSPADYVLFSPGTARQNNLNLTYGTGGFAFAEPGTYEVMAAFVITIRGTPHDTEYVVYSDPLQIQVAAPKTMDEERDALTLFREDVGLYFALGGAHDMDKTRDALEEVRERRQGKAKKIKDPIVANIIRCKGIDTGRSYVRFQDGKFKEYIGDRAQAANLLDTLTTQALKAFDDDTVASTKSLAKKHRKAAK